MFKCNNQAVKTKHVMANTPGKEGCSKESCMQINSYKRWTIHWVFYDKFVSGSMGAMWN